MTSSNHRRSTWRDLSAGTAVLPDWLPLVALADTCSTDLLALAAASAGVEFAAGTGPATLERMAAAGCFEPLDAGAPGVRRLRPEVREEMLAEIDSTAPGVAGALKGLLAAGLAKPAAGLGPQLAKWAFDAGSWADLVAVWLSYPPGDLLADPGARAIFASAPTELRASMPGLTFSAALSSAYDPEAGRVDLDRMVGHLIRDGLTLHAQWARKETPEARVVGGTLWMLAQATIPESVEDPLLEGPTATYRELGRVIRDASLTGGAVTARALTLFHSISSLVALLRADWSRARREGELAMILSDKCGFPGFLAALAVAASSAASGSTQYAGIADRFLAQHAAHGCAVGAWIEPAFHLVRADAAIRELDRERAVNHLRLHSTEGSFTRWFNVGPMQAMVLGTAAILWDYPERGLAEFDSIVAESGHELEHAKPWRLLLLRARAELLLSLGAVNRAEQIIRDLLASGDDSVSAVPAAWFHLCAGDFARAVAKADEGIYELKISLADRAFLYAVKSAALHQAGAAEELVGSAATAACVVCEQASTLVPFAALPSGARSYLLAEHARHHGATDCFLTRALRRGAFDDLRHNVVPSRVLVRLTRREEVLLPLLATAATVQEIANQQYVSVNTVRKQVVALREKLGAASRADLIRRANELGLLKHPAKSGRPS
ncbi:MAG: response regulator transcription factor [Propionibacteriaceae bacterium]|nr:response regulator transcription factor [Propionibacteriaceae bacterium]